MKKFTKQLISLSLALALIVTTFLAMPTSVSAASKPTSKKATIKMTDTTISGFKTITGTLTVNNKTVIVYGKNSKGKNVYTYSTNGKKFKKAALLGLDGDVSYHVSKNTIYVIARNSQGTSTKYKSATTAKGLSSAPVVSIIDQVKLPADYSADNFSCYTDNGVNGKLYMVAYYYGDVTMNYSIVLNGDKVTAVNLTEMVQKQYPNYNISYISINPNYYSKSYSAAAYGSGWDKNTGKDVSFVFKTTDGIKFEPMASVPGTYDDASVQYNWYNSKLFAWVSSYGSSISPMTSNNKGIFYLYSGDKWTKCTTSKKCATGFKMGYYANAYYNDVTSSNDFFVAQYNIKNATQILYTANGKTWKSLPKLSYSKTAKAKKYTFSHVVFRKTKSGTYASETYCDSNENNQFYTVISKLSNGKWKTLKALTITATEKTPYLEMLDSSVPSLIYNNGKTTVGYNLSTGKSYTMPFKYTYNNFNSGDNIIYWQDKNLYVTRNGCKNVTKVTLKVGSKTLKSKITDVEYTKINKNSLTYIVCGGKMYYVPYTQLSKTK